MKNETLGQRIERVRREKGLPTQAEIKRQNIARRRAERGLRPQEAK